MNDHFKAASKRYTGLLPKNKQTEGYLINPISEVDCEIIIELSQLLKKAGFNKALAILKEYKGTVKDVEIRDQLLQCNIDTKPQKLSREAEEFIEDLTEGKERNRDRKFIVIDEHRFSSDLIYGYKIEDKTEGDSEQYDIVLNPCKDDATRLPLYANEAFTFYDYDKCIETVKLIDEQMKKSNVKFVDREDDE